MIELIENHPLDTEWLAGMITDPDELYLVWPKASWPFDHAQWREALDPAHGHKSFRVRAEGQIVGHAAMRRQEEPGVYGVNFLYLVPYWRGRGLGREVVGALERFGREELAAEKLVLVVRSYNPRARQCYMKCGFSAYKTEGTLIRMEKAIPEIQGNTG